MARVKYWGITVEKHIKDGVLVSTRYDGKFVICKITNGERKEILVFHPGDILDEGCKTLEKSFKAFVVKVTQEKFKITPDVKNYLLQMEQRIKRNSK